MNVRRFRFPWRVFLVTGMAQICLVVVALTASGWAARKSFEQSFRAQIRTQLTEMLRSLSRDLSRDLGRDLGAQDTTPDSWCARHATLGPGQNAPGEINGTEPGRTRFTLLRDDGRVLCDSETPAARWPQLPNHSDRPEIAAARAGGLGFDSRRSQTLGQEYIYGAVHLPAVRLYLRVAVPLSQLRAALTHFDRHLLVVLFGLALILGSLALWNARHLINPLARLLNAARTRPRPKRRADANFFGEWAELENNIEELRRDVAEQSESLARERSELSQLMAAISDAILAVDEKGLPLFYNTRFALIMNNAGLTPPPNTTEAYPSYLGSRAVEESFARALNSAQTVALNAVELGARAPDEAKGRGPYYSLAVSPLRRPDGSVYGAVGVFRDVTALKLSEQIRIDFVANVSHELRTPLTAIKGYTQTLLEDLRAGRGATLSFLEIIERNGDRLMHLVHDLLDLSDLDATVDLSPRRVDTAAYSLQIVAQMQSALNLRQQSVTVQALADEVWADPGRLEQVLTNLLDNASKYSPAGARLGVEWRRSGEETLLMVTDNGPGIPREHHARLFERFYRVDKARSRERGGTGLGLAIVKHIMQRHGGSVAVESPVEWVAGVARGSTFLCRFPDSRGEPSRSEENPL